MIDTLHQEFEYYIQHQDDFVRQYNGKVVALKDQAVVGVYESEWEAVRETAKHHAPGTFVVQRVSPGPDAYTTYVSNPHRLSADFRR